MAISFWNSGIKINLSFGIWPLLFIIFFIFSLITAFSFLIIHLRISDTKKINAIIQEKLAEERSKLQTEFEKNKETESEEKEDSNLAANKIVPKGKFKSEESFANKLLINLSNNLQTSIGIYYQLERKSKKFRFLTGFGLTGEAPPSDFKLGENLNGQVAESKEIVFLREIPEEYFEIESGLGKSKPRSIIIAPIVNNNRTMAIIEIATFIEVDTKSEKIIKEVCTLAANKLEQLNKS